MFDKFRNFATRLESPAVFMEAVTPSDIVDLPTPSRALNVAESGMVRVTTVGGSTGDLFIASGGAFPVRVRRIWATGTTALGIVALS